MRVALALTLIVLVLPAVLLAAPREDAVRPRPAPPAVRAPVPAFPQPAPRAETKPDRRERRTPRPESRAAGEPEDGRLVNGRALRERGPGYKTWDAIEKTVPNRRWRRYGSGRLLRTLRRVLAAYDRRHPKAKPVLVGDLSRPHGGDFGKRFGGLGHVSHQNGLDADVYYPRKDAVLRAPRGPGDVDRKAAQELVTAFVKEGAELVFVGPALDLKGPAAVVQPLVHHDDHLHVRLRG